MNFTVDNQKLDYLRQARHNVNAASAALEEPKGLLSTLKEDVKAHGFDRNGFDYARRASNRKPPEAQARIWSVLVASIAFGIFAQRDIEDAIQEAHDLAARNGEDPPPEPSLAEAMRDAIDKDGGEHKPAFLTREEVTAAAGKKAAVEKAKRPNGNGHSKPKLLPPEKRGKIPVRGRKGEQSPRA